VTGRAGGTAPGAVTVHRDVVFSRPAGFRPLSLDLYVPAAPARALCLYLHGGGWRAGSRSDGPGPSRLWSPSFFERAAAMGLAMASADYRLSGEATYPAQLDDVRAAAGFLATHRASFGVGAQRTTAWGVSAGGHLAALLALTGPPASPGVDAVVCWYAPTDLDALSADCDRAGGRGERGPDARESQLIGAPLDERPDLVKEASPVSFAHAGAPPFLFLHGTADTLVPPRQSQRLAAALAGAGASATVELVDGGTHMFSELDDEATARLVARSVRFLLGPEGA
jgi:acetyl esterase/lipase